MNVRCESAYLTSVCLPVIRSLHYIFLCVCLGSPHLQHVADVEDGAVLSGVHV